MYPLTRNPEYQLKKRRRQLILWHKDKTRRVVCNEGAALVWHFAGENLSAPAIADKVQDLVDAEPAVVRRDVFDAVANLLSRGILLEPDRPQAGRGRVYVKYLGRLGNRMFIYSVGRMIAERLGFSLHVEPIPGFPRTIHPRQDASLPEPADEAIQVVDDRTGSLEPMLTDRTPRIIHVNGYLQRYELIRPLKEELRKIFRLPEPHSPPGPEDLVVHVRGGDVWAWNRAPNAHGHPAPLSAGYYASIIEASDYDKLIVVAERGEDPVALYLQNRFGAEIVSGSVLDDLAFMQHAKRFVMSPSTYAWWAAWLSDATVVHFPDSPYFGAGNHDNGRENATDLVVFDESRYVRHPIIDPLAHWRGGLSDMERALGGMARETFHSLPEVPGASVVITPKYSNRADLEACVGAVRDNLYGAQSVRVVSGREIPDSAKCIAPEAFPFSRPDVAGALESRGLAAHAAEIYFNLLALHAPLLPANPSRYTVILEPDVILLHPLDIVRGGSIFLDVDPGRNGKPGAHLARLLPDCAAALEGHAPANNLVVIDNGVFRELAKYIEHLHGSSMWQAYCRCVEAGEPRATVYELYSAFVLSRHPETVTPRNLRWRLVFERPALERMRGNGYHYAVIGERLAAESTCSKQSSGPAGSGAELFPPFANYQRFASRLDHSRIVPFRRTTAKTRRAESGYLLESKATRQTIGLEESAIAVLDRINGVDSIDTIIVKLAADRNVDAARVRDDVLSTIYTLSCHLLVDLRVRGMPSSPAENTRPARSAFIEEVEREAAFRAGKFYADPSYFDPALIPIPGKGRHEVLVQIRNGEPSVQSGAHKRAVRFAESLARYTRSDDHFALIASFGDNTRGSDAYPLFAHSRPRGYDQVILWPLDGYHTQDSANFGARIFEEDRPWNEKIPHAIWRGASTGLSIYGKSSDEIAELALRPVVWSHPETHEVRHKANRLQLVTAFKDHPTIDVGFSNLCQMDDAASAWMTNQGLLKSRMPKSALLTRKYLVVVEGNDYASQLPWALHSNSLVLMPDCVYENIIFRALEPWTHFVPLRADFSDLEEKVDWCRNNDARCQQMARQATAYMRDFYFESREEAIRKRVLEVYARNYRVAAGGRPESAAGSPKPMIVGCYYELDKAKHSPNEYREWINNFFEIRTPKVVFTDRKTWERHFASMERADVAFRIVEMEEFIGAKWRGAFDHQWSIDPESMIHSVDLYMVWNEKVHFVQRAIEEFGHRYNYFVYCDIGGFRQARYKRWYREWPDTKALGRVSPDKIVCLQVAGTIGGTIFCGGVEAWLAFHRLYYRTLAKCINEDGFCGKDQNIFEILPGQRPELFHVVKARRADDYCQDEWFYLQPYLAGLVENDKR